MSWNEIYKNNPRIISGTIIRIFIDVVRHSVGDDSTDEK